LSKKSLYWKLLLVLISLLLTSTGLKSE